MASDECNSTADCLNVGVGIPRVCYGDVEFSDRVNFCECSNWYGWTGSECNIKSGQLRYSICALVVTATWCIIIMLLSGRTLSFHVRKTLLVKGKTMNPVFYTGSLVFLGAALLLVYALINIPSFFDSSRFEVVFYNTMGPGDIEDVTALGGKVGTYCIVSLGTVYCLVSTQIIISWYDVIEKTTKIYPNILKVSPETVKKGIKILIIFEFVLSIGLLASEYIIGININLMMQGLLLLLFHLLGGHSLVLALRTALGEADDQAIKAIKIVTMSYRMNIAVIAIAVVVLIVGVSFYTAVDGSLQPGKFNPVSVCRDLIAACALCLFTFDSWYVHNVSRNVLGLDNEIGWLPNVRKYFNYGAHLKHDTADRDSQQINYQQLGRTEEHSL